MANYTELNVYKATYGLLFEVLTASKSFNRDFKYTIGETTLAMRNIIAAICTITA